jgi:mannitol-1-phosphate 5-dehydrogenase
MKKALIHGAGNIGRRFIGKIFSESGYKVCFIDINENIVNEINRREEYPVKFETI